MSALPEVLGVMSLLEVDGQSVRMSSTRSIPRRLGAPSWRRTMHQWQARNGAIDDGLRLAPAVPFFLGGKFGAAEMRAKESIALMRFRADVHRQVKDLPDGARIRIRIEQDSP
jgi:hypothetical protein